MSASSPHPLTPGQLKRRLNLYPPFLFNRIRVVEIDPEFRVLTVRVKPSLLTRNLQGTLFGGTIYASADAFFALMYWQALAHRGLRVQAWVRTATVRFKKPARSLNLRFEISAERFEAAAAAVEREGRFVHTHTVAAIDDRGETCAEIDNEVYLRLPRVAEKDRPAF